MSNYRKRRSYPGNYSKPKGRKSSGKQFIKIIAIGLAAIACISLASSLLSRSSDETKPPDSVVEPTEPVEPVIESGYLLYQLAENGGKKYLNIRDSSTGGSLKTKADDACFYTWNADYNTLVSDTGRFLCIFDDLDDTVFRTYLLRPDVRVAQFVLNDTIVEGQSCPLEEGKAYFLIGFNGLEQCYYVGTTLDGEFLSTINFDEACPVYVEYVTRQVAS